MIKRATVELEGLSVSYQSAGDGPALVLLHGFSYDSRAWRPQMEALSDHFTVIAWDAPGAGQSFDPPDTFGISDWAGCLDGFLDAIAADEAHVLGLSWGGILAQEYYQRYPDRVLSLTLADTYAGWKGSLPEPIPQERLEACLRDSSLPPDEFLSKYLPGMFSEAVADEVRNEAARCMSEFHPAGFRLMARASADADTRDFLANIKVPTLLIWGEADVRSPVAVARQFHEAIPGSTLAIIPGAGHVSNMEQPELFNALVRGFCLGVSGG